jgi:hypothetical protein
MNAYYGIFAYNDATTSSFLLNSASAEYGIRMMVPTGCTIDALYVYLTLFNGSTASSSLSCHLVSGLTASMFRAGETASALASVQGVTVGSLGWLKFNFDNSYYASTGEFLWFRIANNTPNPATNHPGIQVSGNMGDKLASIGYGNNAGYPFAGYTTTTRWTTNGNFARGPTALVLTTHEGVQRFFGDPFSYYYNPTDDAPLMYSNSNFRGWLWTMDTSANYVTNMFVYPINTMWNRWAIIQYPVTASENYLFDLFDTNFINHYTHNGSIPIFVQTTQRQPAGVPLKLMPKNQYYFAVLKDATSTAEIPCISIPLNGSAVNSTFRTLLFNMFPPLLDFWVAQNYFDIDKSQDSFISYIPTNSELSSALIGGLVVGIFSLPYPYSGTI